MLSADQILIAAGGALLQGRKKVKFKSISTDSRSIQPGSLFIPLNGPNYNGHNFISEALKKGAKGILISKKISKLPGDIVCIKVKNTLKALQDLAKSHRLKFKIPIIAVTGSSGKTTTKDMLAAILSQKGKTLKTAGNYNNEIGVPLTLLKLNKTHKFAVIEMAMQNSGEIAELACMVQPTLALITNIGEAHLENLKTQKTVASAKSEIFKYLSKNHYAILPADDRYFNFLKKSVKRGKVITFGVKKTADIRTNQIENSSESVSFILSHKYKITLPFPGTQNVANALAAIAAAKILKINKKCIIAGLKNLKPSGKRMQILKKNHIRIINDTYNANPSSMKAAISVLHDQEGTRRIAVLGDMLELGKKSKYFHLEIGKFAGRQNVNLLITVGKMAKYSARAAVKAGLNKNQVYHFTAKAKAIKLLRQILRPNDAVLVKGSRGMRMEEIVEAIILEKRENKNESNHTKFISKGLRKTSI